MGIEELTAPLIEPFKNAVGPLQDLISGHRTNHQDMLTLVQSLMEAADGGELFVGVTASAVLQATERLVQMSDQRMGAMDKLVAGFSSTANRALSAVEGVLSAFLPTDLLDKVIENFDIVGVIMEGQSIVQDAINAVLQTFLDELANPLSLLIDVAEGAVEMLTGVFPATLLPYAAEVFDAAQEVIQIINVVELLLSEMQALATPVQELFAQIGPINTPEFAGSLAELGQVAKIDLGMLNVVMENLELLAQVAGAQAMNTLNQGPGAGPNQVGCTPTSLPGMGNTMNEYAKIIINTPQGQETVIVPITDQGVQVVIGGAPTQGGGSAGGPITITITSTPPGAMTNPGNIPVSGGMPTGTAMPPGSANMLNPQPLPPYQGGIGTGTGVPTHIPLGVAAGGYGGGYGGGKFVAPTSLPPSVPLGTGGYTGNIHQIGTAVLSNHMPIRGTAILGTGGPSGTMTYSATGGGAMVAGTSAPQMSPAPRGVRSDGSGDIFGMPPMAMGGIYSVGGATASDDDDK